MLVHDAPLLVEVGLDHGYDDVGALWQRLRDR